MKPSTLLFMPLLLLHSLVSLAQGSSVLFPGYTSAATVHSEVDNEAPTRAEHLRQDLEATLKEYLVALDPGPHSARKHVGLPLATTADGSLHLVYDSAAKNMAVEHTLWARPAWSARFNVQTYFGEAGRVGLVASTVF